MAQTDGAAAAARDVGRALAALLADEPAWPPSCPMDFAGARRRLRRAAAGGQPPAEPDAGHGAGRGRPPAPARRTGRPAACSTPSARRRRWTSARAAACRAFRWRSLDPTSAGSLVDSVAQEGGGAARVRRRRWAWPTWRSWPSERRSSVVSRSTASATTWSRRGPARPLPVLAELALPLLARRRHAAGLEGTARPPATKSCERGRGCRPRAGRRGRCGLQPGWSRRFGRPHLRRRAQGAAHAGPLPAPSGRAQPSAARVGG